MTATEVTITARIGNGGASIVGSGVPVSFYDGEPGAGGILLGTVETAVALSPGEFEDVTLVLPAGSSTQSDVWVVADDSGDGTGLHNECDETNNTHFTGPIGGNEPPVAVCRDVVKSADGDCQAGVSADEVDDGSFDPDGDPLTLTLVPAGPYPLGTTQVTLTATDPSGESSTCLATVTVTDNTSPALTCPANQEFEVPEMDDTVPEQMVTFPTGATDNCTDPVPVSCSNPEEFPVGTTLVDCSAVDEAGNVATCEFEVTVDVPLVIVLTSFTAEAGEDGVRLKWTTAAEINNVGFRILRGRPGEEPAAVSGLIPAEGSELGGASYGYLDDERQRPGIVLYYLEDIDTFGRVTRHGPVEVRVRGGSRRK